MTSYAFEGQGGISSPALIYYKDIIEENTAKTIAIAGGAERLWPHVKTHKMREMIEMQMRRGIRRFKCATCSEAQMVAECGAEHLLWAYPLVGPNVERFLSLVERFPNCTFYALEDDLAPLQALSDAATARGMQANVLLDVNVGMNRTGVAPERIVEFYRQSANMQGVRLRGLHCYDGHIHDTALDVRRSHAEQGMSAIPGIREELRREGFDADIVILGGTPTFPCHAAQGWGFLSPGTLFVSDAGYRASYPDIDVVPAAAVLTRVVSHPADGLFTLDTGYKAISADARPRGVLVGYEDKCESVLESEEHWVFRMKPEYRHLRPEIGAELFVIPTHICPTTSMYDAVYVCSGGKLTDIWQVAARERVGGVRIEEVLR